MQKLRFQEVGSVGKEIRFGRGKRYEVFYREQQLSKVGTAYVRRYKIAEVEANSKREVIPRLFERDFYFKGHHISAFNPNNFVVKPLAHHPKSVYASRVF